MEKLAIIELNEVGVGLSLNEVSNGKYRTFKEDFDRFDLYDEVSKDKLLKPKTISSLLAVLKMYKKIIDDNGVEKVVAVASQFLLKARNQKGFLDEIYNNTNITFNYRTEEDQVKQIYTSVVNSIDNSKGYIINVGVNDITLVKYNRRTTLGSSVLPFGFLSCIYDEKGEKRSYEEIVKFVTSSLKSTNFFSAEDDEIACVGVGEPFINLGRIAKKIDRYPLLLDNNYQVSASTFDKVEKFITELDLEKIKRVKGIIANTTDELLAGMAIINAILKYLKIKEITISTANTKDGLTRLSIGNDALDRYSDLLANSFDFYREFLPWDTNINIRVNNLAGILFKQLKVMHKLPRNYVKVLRVASYMFNSGRLIGCDDYEKHGFYIILNSGLTGVSQKDLLLASFACLCQNPDNFNLSDWIKYQAILSDEDLGAVRKLGILVKLASALNSSKEANVTDIVCDLLGDSVIMKTVSNGDPSYDVMQGIKISEDFRKLFKKNLQLI